MTIYVDELPKSCTDCPCYDCEWGDCNLEDINLMPTNDFSRYTQRHQDCPLHSIADHTKRVRKEVLDELCNMLGDRAELIDFGNGCAEFMFTTYDLEMCSKEILDQIQGEKK